MALMHNIQGNRQMPMINSMFRDALLVSAEHMAPVQDDLQMALDGFSKEDKVKLTDGLNKLGWGVRNGVVLGGTYKYQSDPKAVKELLNSFKDKYPELFTKINEKRITDKKYDRRFEKLHQFEFNSVADRDNWAKEKGFVKKGRFYIDPNNPNNIIMTKVFRDKKVDKDTWDTWNKKKRDFDDYTLEDKDEGIYERYITEGSSDVVDPNTGIRPFEGRETASQSPFPMLLPRYNRIPPVLFQPGLQQIGHYQSNPIKVTAEESVRSLHNNFNHLSDTAYNNNPYTAGALTANAFAQTQDSIVKAESQAAMMNTQDRRQVEDSNEQRMLQRDNINLQLKGQYEDKANAAMDNFVKSWRGYYDSLNQENVNNYNTTNQRIMLNAVNQDMEIDAFGRIRQVGSPYFNVGIHMGKDGKTYQYDPKTGTHKEVKVTTVDGNTTTTTKTVDNASKKRKGGYLKSGIKSYLK